MKITQLFYFYFRAIYQTSIKDYRVFLIRLMFWLILYSISSIIIYSLTRSSSLDSFMSGKSLESYISEFIIYYAVLDVLISFYFKINPDKTFIIYLSPFNISNNLKLIGLCFFSFLNFRQFLYLIFTIILINHIEFILLVNLILLSVNLRLFSIYLKELKKTNIFFSIILVFSLLYVLLNQLNLLVIELIATQYLFLLINIFIIFFYVKKKIFYENINNYQSKNYLYLKIFKENIMFNFIFSLLVRNRWTREVIVLILISLIAYSFNFFLGVVDVKYFQLLINVFIISISTSLFVFLIPTLNSFYPCLLINSFKFKLYLKLILFFSYFILLFLSLLIYYSALQLSYLSFSRFFLMQTVFSLFIIPFFLYVILKVNAKFNINLNDSAFTGYYPMYYYIVNFIFNLIIPFLVGFLASYFESSIYAEFSFIYNKYFFLLLISLSVIICYFIIEFFVSRSFNNNIQLIKLFKR